MVRRELFGGEARQAELVFLAKYLCSDCAELGKVWDHWGPPDHCSREGIAALDGYDCESLLGYGEPWPAIWSLEVSGVCLLERRDLSDRIFVSKDTQDLLRAYGLELLFTEPSRGGEPGDVGYSCIPHWDAVLGIVLPSDPSSNLSGSHARIRAECQHEWDISGTHTISPESLVVSPAQQSKFHRLVADYRLQVVDRTLHARKGALIAKEHDPSTGHQEPSTADI